jgi:hypothetical protein
VPFQSDLVGRNPGLYDHGRLEPMTDVFLRERQHYCPFDRCMQGERELDLTQFNAVTAYLHLMVDAAPELEVSILMSLNQVTGPAGKETYAAVNLDGLEGLRGQLGEAPITTHQRRAAQS